MVDPILSLPTLLPLEFHLLDGLGVSHDLSAVKHLRKTHKIIMDPFGMDSTGKNIAGPFAMDPFALAYCSSNGWVTIAHENMEEAKAHLTQIEGKAHYAVFVDLMKKGYFVIGGFKYGCDFCIYEEDPLKVHACALVFVDESDTKGGKTLDIIEINRVSMIAKKKCVVASVEEGGTKSMEFSGIGKKNLLGVEYTNFEKDERFYKDRKGGKA